ncbi:MAG: SCO1664 family protein [Acidimicrobiia bacterium]
MLERGELEVLGRMPWASNHTYLGRLCLDGPGEGGVPEKQGPGGVPEKQEALAVYKPRRGERPLWDFPEGTLCQREVASHLVSEGLGWAIVPPTILRPGPLGEGMVQLFVDHDPENHYFTLRDAYRDRFRQFALFDVVINNADRKSGHCLLDADGHVWGIDHGVTFHQSVKLRTVIWDFEGERIEDDLAAVLARLDDGLDGELGLELACLLAPADVDAARRRLKWLLSRRVFPSPMTDYPYPWPMV